jgi:8-oxo-dGTP diphosphatase
MKHASVGVSVIIRKHVDLVSMVLLGKRKGSHAPDTWAFPGGHIDYGETLNNAVRREVEEETGLKLGEIQVHQHCPFTNTVFITDEKHYVTLFFEAQYIGGEPKLREPEKCDEWRWFDVRDLPRPLFEPAKQFFEFLRARETIVEREAFLPDWLLNQVGHTPLAAHDPTYLERVAKMLDEARDEQQNQPPTNAAAKT